MQEQKDHLQSKWQEFLGKYKKKSKQSTQFTIDQQLTILVDWVQKTQRQFLTQLNSEQQTKIVQFKKHGYLSQRNENEGQKTNHEASSSDLDILRNIILKYRQSEDCPQQYFKQYHLIRPLVVQFLAHTPTKQLNPQKNTNQSSKYKLKPQQKIQVPNNLQSLKMYDSYVSNYTPQQSDTPSTLENNKYLHMIYTHFCRQTCSKARPTFDDLASAASQMTVNKWMVFCKEFNFIEKLNKKELIDIFKKSTNYLSTMDKSQFVNGVKSIKNRLKVSNKEFQSNVLQINNIWGFRQKMNGFKIQYYGPLRNFQFEGRINEAKRKQQFLQLSHVYRENKKKQKTIEAKPLKISIKRQEHNKTINLISLPRVIKSPDKHTNREKVNQKSSYVSLFKNKMNGATRSTVHTRAHSQYGKKINLENKSGVRMMKSEITNHENQEKQEPKCIKQVVDDIDSDTESDQILKTHFKNQKDKKIKLSMLMSVPPTQKILFDHHTEEEDESMMITQYRR